MSNMVKELDVNINNVLVKLYKPSVVKAVLHLLLMLYAAWIAPTPPQAILDLFENLYFKLFVFSLILWTAQFSPSTSILIALGFLITINYANTGKLWEHLEDVVAPEQQIQQSVEAVNLLAEKALEPTPTEPVVVDTLVQEATKSITTQEGAIAVNNLAVQASIAEAGDQEKVADATKTAIDSINTPVSQEQQSIDAVSVLAAITLEPIPAELAVVDSLVKEATKSITTQDGLDAVNNLAIQASIAEPGDQQKVADAMNVAINSIPSPVPITESPVPITESPVPIAESPSPIVENENLSPLIESQSSESPSQSSGCYPVRTYDMAQVSGIEEVEALSPFEF